MIPIDRDAFTARVLDNIQAGRPAFDGTADALGEETAREWQALSDAAMADLEEFRQRELVVHDALAKLIEENKAALAVRDRGK